jgi:hypothetical protein
MQFAGGQNFLGWVFWSEKKVQNFSADFVS